MTHADRRLDSRNFCFEFGRWLLLFSLVGIINVVLISSSLADAVPGDPLNGDGNVTRTLVTYTDLTTVVVPGSPVDDAAFGVPASAAPPLHQFEGTLELIDESTIGSFTNVSGAGSIVAAGQKLPEISIEFVQNGSHLVPTIQQLRITGSTYWNLIVGPGRAWTENSDSGLTRAAFPFALVQRNQNCTHNGVMTFLFNDSTVSNVRYQITQETCNLRKFNMWGQLAASYTPDSVDDAEEIQDLYAAEVSNRLPSKLFSELATDYPSASIVTSATTTLAAAASAGATNIRVASVTGLAVGQIIRIDTGGPTPEIRTITGPVSGAYAFNGTTGAGGTGVNIAPALTAAHSSGATVARPANFGAVAETNVFGVLYNGINYVSDCPTRFGFYPFCADFRLPSYSTAKTLMANTALMRLSEVYGDEVYDLKLRDYIPEMVLSGNWPADTSGTFNNAADMATGNWSSKGYQIDENAATTFLTAETYSAKMTASLNYVHRAGQQDVTWVYRTSDHFLLGAAMNGYLSSMLETEADVFDLLVEDVFIPLKMSNASLATLRTDNAAQLTSSPTAGAAFAGYGLFLNADDMAKLAKLFNNDLGKIGDEQVLDKRQVLAGLQRLQSDRGVPANSSLLTAADAIAGSYRYSNGFWSYPTTSFVSGCTLRLPFLSGYGGITVALMPNGATYYQFSDGGSFVWASSATELNKIAPMCAATTTVVSSDAPVQAPGSPVTLTASVSSASRNWAPTGTVRFKNGVSFITNHLQLDENGEAEYTTSALALGSHSITAEYSQENTSSTAAYTSTSSTTTISGANCTTGTGTVTLNVGSSTGFAVGDDVLLGSSNAFGAAVDEVRITAIPSGTSIQYIGNCTYFTHTQPFPVLLRKTAGGGFAAGSSAAFIQEITPLADLSITKSDQVDPVIAGGELTYTITVANAGPSDASDVVVTDTLPSGVSLVSTTGCVEDNTGVPTCSLGTITAAGQKQYSVTVEVSPAVAHGATLTNSVSVTSATADSDEDNNSITENTAVVRQADLSISKVDSVDPVTAGGQLSYTITVENSGPSDADGVVVADTLPAGVSLVSTTGCAEDDTGVPTCTLGTIATDADAEFTVVVMVDADAENGGTLTNNASVASTTADPEEDNNSTSENTAVVGGADLSISKTDSVDPVFAGDELTYTITVDNAGPGIASDVVVTDTLPEGVSLVSTSGCDEDDTGVPNCSLGDIVAGGDAQYTVTVTVDSDLAHGTTLSNSVSVTTTTHDGDEDNNSTSQDTLVNRSSDLSITKADSVDPVAIGKSLVYTIMVSNAGPSDADDVVVTETLPEGVSLISTAGCAEDDAGVPTCNLGGIIAGDSAQYTVTVSVNSGLEEGDTLTNEVSVVSNSADPDEDNNSTTEDTEVALQAAVIFKDSFEPETP